MRAAGTLREGLRSDAARSEGNAHFRAGRYEAAVSSYTQALDYTPDDPKLRSNRAAAYTSLRKYDFALGDCEAAIRLVPTWPKAYFRKAFILESRAEWDAAEVVYTTVLRDCRLQQEDSTKAKHRLATVRSRKLALI